MTIKDSKRTIFLPKTKFHSPYLYLAASWIIVLFFYNLYWSKLLPKLSISLLLFLLFTIAISIIIFFYTPCPSFKITINEKKELSNSKKWFYITLFLFCLELIYFKGFPLYFLLRGEFVYAEFGLPFVHVIYFTIASLFCSKCFFVYLVTKNRKFLLLSICFLFPGFVCFTRSFILYNIIYWLIIYLSVRIVKINNKKKLRKIVIMLFLSLVVLYLFGLAGEKRSSTDDLSRGLSYIEQLAKPSENFGNKSPILLWAYCYITTPLANLQNTIISTKTNYLSDIQDLNSIFFHFLPELIKKRLFTETKKASLIVPYFNVSTIYASAYIYLGPFGLFYSFIGSLIIIILTYSLKRNNIYSFLSFIYLAVILFFNMFTNMFNFMGLSPVYILALFFSLFSTENKRFFS